MPLGSKFEFGNKKKIISFGCAVIVAIVVLTLVGPGAWSLRKTARGLTSIFPIPSALIFGFCWLGGWFVALFATEESDYRWRGISIIAISVILGALLLAPLTA